MKSLSKRRLRAQRAHMYCFVLAMEHLIATSPDHFVDVAHPVYDVSSNWQDLGVAAGAAGLRGGQAKQAEHLRVNPRPWISARRGRGEAGTGTCGLACVCIARRRGIELIGADDSATSRRLPMWLRRGVVRAY